MTIIARSVPLPTLLALLAALGAAAVWFYSLRDAGRAASDVIASVKRIRRVYPRKRFFSKADNSPIASVNDPAEAATALLIALASSRGHLSPVAEAAIKDEMRTTIGQSNVDEAFRCARRVADHANDPGDLTLRFAKLWMSALQPSERAELHAMATRIAAVDGEPTDLQAGCLRALQIRLGLTRA
jgi:hypothetical protein